MPIWLVIVIGVVAVGPLVGFAAHRTAQWAESRGWIYYREKARFRGSSLGLLEEIYTPSVEHVFEEQAGEHARADVAESGEGEDGGPSGPVGEAPG